MLFAVAGRLLCELVSVGIIVAAPFVQRDGRWTAPYTGSANETATYL